MIQTKLSLLIAITITVLAAGWLISGQFVDNSNLKKESAENQKKKCTPKTRNRKDASA
jgi:uncharacterized membrane protein YciS (DUF1049 family)